jgi:hypothetical protein
MAKSSVPISDMDLDSAQKRIVTESTSKSSFRNVRRTTVILVSLALTLDSSQNLKRILSFLQPVVVFPYVKVNGAYLLTDSQIKFGTENGVTQQHYDTTTRSNFPAKYEPVERSDWRTKKSNVSLDYYGMYLLKNQNVIGARHSTRDKGIIVINCERKNCDKLSNHLPTGNESNQSTTASDFYPHDGVKRLLPNPRRIAEVSVTNFILNSRKTNDIAKIMLQ